ncbi:GIY-YIG nuclease family protein [Streptomyces aureoversilis]|uniref:GIY-YIG nuclease family protein n=1 Tax=Streptomyces aureoversilis TaxID=67277 RepID=A0ABV9ZSX8_9ACTN
MTEMPLHTTHGQMIQRAEGDEVALYRLFDANHQLLYVGISKDPMGRWREHVANSWWRDVAEYSVTWYPTRAEARAAEKTALTSENAKHNVHSAPCHGAYWKAVLGTPEARAQRAARASQIAKGHRGSKRPAKNREGVSDE